MASKSSPSQSLRSILVVMLIIVLAGGAGVFYLAIEQVRTYAIEVNHTVADAEASGSQVSKLQNLRGELTESEASIAKANQMFATPATYQTQAIADVRTYAQANGITVTSTVFEPAPAGETPKLLVGLRSPVPYPSLLQFLDAIEGSVPKLQVATISVSTIPNGAAGAVTVNELKITIATR